jgi:hypothetical protein
MSAPKRKPVPSVVSKRDPRGVEKDVHHSLEDSTTLKLWYAQSINELLAILHAAVAFFEFDAATSPARIWVIKDESGKFRGTAIDPVLYKSGRIRGRFKFDLDPSNFGVVSRRKQHDDHHPNAGGLQHLVLSPVLPTLPELRAW